MPEKKLLLLTILFITLFEIALTARPSCDANGKCKYGGRCGPDNKCYCTFKCKRPLWETSLNSLYCSPRTKTKPMKLYWNLCYLAATACETQQDIPLIKYDVNKPNKAKRCQGSNVERWKLCSKPEDFMGPCGGTLQSSTVGDGGICLQDVRTNNRRCECNSKKTGKECEKKIVGLKALMVANTSTPGGDGSRSGTHLGIIIAVSSAAGVFLAVAIFLIYRNRTRRGADKDLEPDECTKPSIVKQSSNNRSEEQFQTMNKEGQKLIKSSACGSTVTWESQENSAGSSFASGRQRLNGSSVRGIQDANNNSSSSIKMCDIDNQSSSVRVTKSNFEAGNFVMNISQNTPAHSSPTVKYDHSAIEDHLSFEGVPKKSQKDVNTI